MKPLKNRKNKMILGIIALLFFGLMVIYRLETPTYFGTIPMEQLTTIPVNELPEDTLYITQGRTRYQRGEMTLIIPSIEVYTPVGESTKPQGLERMPGLYEFSQMPGYGNVNVSIAGHRDIFDMVFYDLDKLSAGDYAYLVFADTIYQYEYRESRVIPPDDWRVILPQGFSCLTLTTCDPIGTTLNRLIATAKLIDITEYHDSYNFAANKNT